MAHHKSFLLPPLLAAATLLLALLAASGEARHLHRINRHSLFNAAALCRNAQHIDLCNDLAKSPGVSSPLSLVGAAVRIAASKAERAQTEVGQLVASPATSKILKECLQSCQDSYGSALDSLHHTENLLHSGGRHADVMTELTAASTFVETCSDSFDDFPEVQSPIDHLQSNLGKLVSTSLDLAAALK
ncbi:uncharacterized protein [Typha latifolia]|uniref:uncharacterized protein n=1 Tax=Typha latifolia TaxID=4733 RepID=UPI003C307E64